MRPTRHVNEITLDPLDNKRLAELCGQFDENLRKVESYLGVEINNRANHFQIIGTENTIIKAGDVLKHLYNETEKKNQLDAAKVHLILQTSHNTTESLPEGPMPKLISCLIIFLT